MPGPIILPAENPESNLANALLLSSIEVISAIQPPQAGLVALPNKPLIVLDKMSKINSNNPEIYPEFPKDIHTLKRHRDIANPNKPINTTLFLPTESLRLPQ